MPQPEQSSSDAPRAWKNNYECCRGHAGSLCMATSLAICLLDHVDDRPDTVFRQGVRPVPVANDGLGAMNIQVTIKSAITQLEIAAFHPADHVLTACPLISVAPHAIVPPCDVLAPLTIHGKDILISYREPVG